MMTEKTESKLDAFDVEARRQTLVGLSPKITGSVLTML
jgi:hypothetical protein